MIDPRGNYNAAVLQFGEAIRECPEYSAAYFWRGQSYVALQQNQSALADFRTVVKISNDPASRQQAEKFIAEIEGPRSTPSPVVVNSNGNTNTNTNANGNTSTNTNTSVANGNANTSNTNQDSTPIVHAQVNEMFATDKSTRISALSHLILKKKNDSKAVKHRGGPRESEE